MSDSEQNTIFETASAVSSAVKAMPRAGSKSPAPHALSTAALAVAAQHFERAYSPIVLAGVRPRDRGRAGRGNRSYRFISATSSRSATSAGYYFGNIVGISLMSLLAFQTADIYQVQAFRGHEKQYMRLASAWSVVFLLAVTTSFFTKSGDEFSRVWLGSYYVVGLLVAHRIPARSVSPGAPLDTRKVASTAAPSLSARAAAARR